MAIKSWVDFKPAGDTYWEWWSAANNLCGCFDTKEQLIEAIADYITLHGWNGAKYVLQEIAGEFRADNLPHVSMKVLSGEELFKLALTYG